jgi:zinc protease
MNLAQAMSRVPTHVEKLDNGMTVVVRQDSSAPVVAIVTHVGVGYLDEPDELTGISHVLEHMFFKGTPRLAPGELGRATKQAGGILNASTGYDRTLYYTVLPSNSLEHGIELQSDALLHSLIDGDELARELQVIIQEAKRKLDSPHAVAQETLYETMFDLHRLRRWRIGTEAGLSRLEREDVFDWYRRTYRPDRIVLSIAGDVDPAQVLELVRTSYGRLEAVGDPPDAGPPEPEHSGLRYRELGGDVKRAYMVWGWQTPGPLHADTAALVVLAVTLGLGWASRLYRGVRDRGLASEAGARNATVRDNGVFGASAVAEPDQALEALRAMAGFLDGSRAMVVREAELERARRIVEARTLRALETAQGQAMMAAEWQALGDWRLGEQHLERILAIDAGDVERVAATWLTPDRATIFVYRPGQREILQPGADGSETLFARNGAVLPAPTELDVAPPTPRESRKVGCAQPVDGVHICTVGDDVRLVILPRRSSPLLTLALAFDGGINTEPANESGWTGLMARTTLKGTARRDAAAIAEAAESLGGSVAPSVSADTMDWSITVPSRHLQAAYGLVHEIVYSPTFPETELATERAATLARLVQLRDDMFAYPLRLALEAAFRDHPYGHRIEESEEALLRVSTGILHARHREYVVNGRPSVFVVGDVDPHEIIELTADSLAGGGSERPAAASAGWPADPETRVVERETAQTAIAIAFPGPARNDPDALALRVFANAIGGLGGALFEDLRSRRSLAYTVSAFPVARRLGGAFAAYIATSPDRAEEARHELIHGIARLAETPLPAPDLERAQRYTIGVRRIQTQTNGAQLDQLAHALMLGRGLDEIRDLEDRVQALTPETIRDAAMRWIDPHRVVSGEVRGIGASR